MRRSLARPPPLLTLTLLATWLVINQTLAPADVLLGAALAVLVAWTSTALRPLRPTMKNLHIGFAVFGLALFDIVRSNINVARIVLGVVRGGDVRSGFVTVPLEMRDPHALAALAVIVTSTPGTVWVGVSPDGATLTLHVLDLRSEEALVRWIKNRYESRLMRVFE